MIVSLVLEEGWAADLLDSRSLVGSVGEQADDEVLESLTEVATINSIEIGIISLLLDKVVVLILEDLGTVGEFTLHNNEDKNTHREQVNLRAVIDELF